MRGAIGVLPMEFEVLAIGEINPLCPGQRIDDRVPVLVQEGQSPERRQNGDMQLQHSVEPLERRGRCPVDLDTFDKPDEHAVDSAERILGMLSNRARQVRGVALARLELSRPRRPGAKRIHAEQDETDEHDEANDRRPHRKRADRLLLGRRALRELDWAHCVLDRGSIAFDRAKFNRVKGLRRPRAD
jgi:hypothetical protein